MTWSPFFRLVTPAPSSTTIPAPSWPRIEGNRPSESCPERVYSSVWQTPVALISTRTSPAFGPSRSTGLICSGLFAFAVTLSLSRGTTATCENSAPSGFQHFVHPQTWLWADCAEIETVTASLLQWQVSLPPANVGEPALTPLSTAGWVETAMAM